MTITQRIADQEWKPNLFIAGFGKCGTWELSNYLSQHPDIFVPYEKEPSTFYDLARYPLYATGDRTGKFKLRVISLNDYYKMFSKGEKYKYRIDATVSYTFDPKYSRILKSFSENAKVILLIRNQTHRLASMYFMSFLAHKENDFARWLDDYFIPDINTYLYHDKIAAYYNEFGDNNLRIIETNNLSSEDVHKQIFEYLEVNPIKITVTHKNANLLGPEDGTGYRHLMSTLASIKLGTLKVAEHIGLEDEVHRGWYVIGDLARQVLRRKSKKNNYSDIIKLIPDTVSSILYEDYRKTLDFVVQHGIMVRPAC
jgi:Sulfotransferase domain